MSKKVEKEPVATPDPAEDEKEPVAVVAETLNLETSEAPSEETPEETPEAVENVVSSEPVVKRGGTHVYVKGFFGFYRNAQFVDCDRPGYGYAANVDDVTLKGLAEDYPGAEVVIEKD